MWLFKSEKDKGRRKRLLSSESLSLCLPSSCYITMIVSAFLLKCRNCLLTRKVSPPCPFPPTPLSWVGMGKGAAWEDCWGKENQGSSDG